MVKDMAKGMEKGMTEDMERDMTEDVEKDVTEDVAKGLTNDTDGELRAKYQKLQEILKECGRVAVAFSSGVDSSFLLQAAKETLGDNVLAVTAQSCWFPQREFDETEEFCQARGIRRCVVSFDGVELPAFANNPPDRCYHCKKALFQRMISVAAEQGFPVIAEGSNTDDDSDYRPGHRAVKELGIRSPLREAGLSKGDIRELSRQMQLRTWSKPSFACLASRFPYGESITREKLAMVEQAEDFLLAEGFTQMRVRIHESVNGDLMGRIELLQEDIPRMLEDELRRRVHARLEELGFTYVSLDLAGFRSGSMNRTLEVPEPGVEV